MAPTFTSDWFSKMSPYWEYHVAPRMRDVTDTRYLRWLEVGSYEGRSALWTLDNVLQTKPSTIDCVDTWGHPYEALFDANTAEAVAAGRLRKYVGKSCVVLPNLRPRSYHGAYVDGSHAEEDVALDLEHVWNLLRDGGVLVADDYASDEYPGVRRAVDAFLGSHFGHYVLLHKAWQVILVKSDIRLDSFYELAHPEGPFQWMLAQASLRVSPRTVVDVGASDGRWSEMASAVWPRSDYLLVEANPTFETALRRTCAKNSRFSYKMVLAAASAGEASCKFHDDNPYQGVDFGTGPGARLVPTATIDELVQGFPSPYLVKLDVHGQELPILQGATKVLADACAVVVEVYCWRQCTGSLRFWELCQYMEWLGFRPSDLTDPLYRPYDGRLSQVDMLFERIDAVGMNTSRYA